MKNCAVLDIGSSKITAIVGDRGVNKTFLIKARRDFEYDGFESGVFFDTEQLKSILFSASSFILSSARNIDTVYVGVPGDFTQVIVKESQISFKKKKKITENDLESLYDSAFVIPSTKTTLINRSAIVYELDDYRRLANPIGNVSGILKGKLSFVLLSNYLIDLVKPCLISGGFENIEFTSTALAEAMYLIEPETRDRIVMLADVGYITTTFSIIQGDGILFQSSFNYGGGYITASLIGQFEMGFKDADSLKKRVNLSKEMTGPCSVINLENGQYFDCEQVTVAVERSLDELSEELSNAIDKSEYVIPEYVPLKITGGGVAYIRGAKERLANKLGINVEVVTPSVPMMDKPTESSVLSLLDLALNQND